MDNICHTLVGAALGESGLKRRTRLGNATLMIAANLPDLDVLVFATGTSPVAFRRGWTHGVVAQLVLPIALAGVMAIVARWSRLRKAPARTSTDLSDVASAAEGDDTVPEGQPPLSLQWLLALSFIGIYSHVFLDYLNNYGVRLLAPIDWRWFYGDAMFIIDLWLWVALGAGVWLARRMQRPVPARGALVFAAGYVIVMLLSARAARDHVIQVWRDARGAEPRSLMVGPLPVTPFRRQVIVDSGDRYEIGTFAWPAAVTFSPDTVPKNHEAAQVIQARDAPGVRQFLVWSRFPYWELRPAEGGTRVTVKDMRFGDRFSATTIVPRGR
jgi:inner membrane protein